MLTLTQCDKDDWWFLEYTEPQPIPSALQCPHCSKDIWREEYTNKPKPEPQFTKSVCNVAIEGTLGEWKEIAQGILDRKCISHHRVAIADYPSCIRFWSPRNTYELYEDEFKCDREEAVVLAKKILEIYESPTLPQEAR